MSELRDRLEAARVQALGHGLPVRRKDARIYALLAECLGICAWVQQEPALLVELRDLLTVSKEGETQKGEGKGKGRRYVLPHSDVYLLVVRYILPEGELRTSVYRYSTALRNAGELQLTPETLLPWMERNGGLQALLRLKFKDRGTPVLNLRTLHLNQPVACPKRGTFTITLRMDHRGFFDLVEGPSVAKV